MSGEKVWLSRCGGYRPEELLAQVEEAFAALGVWEIGRASCRERV